MELKPIIIETNRLILNGFSPHDLTFIFEEYPKDKIMKILGHRTDEDFQKEKLKQINGYAAYNRSFILFLITEKKSNIIIGRCGLHNWNKEHNRAEIGYNIIDENFKRNGFMTETVNAVIEYGFKEIKLHRIEALVGSYNIPSIKILEKQNFFREGLLREHYFIYDKYEDSILFSKLSSEYTDKETDKTTTR